jgi:hypothetical protein
MARTIAEKMSKPLAAADRIENRTGDRQHRHRQIVKERLVRSPISKGAAVEMRPAIPAKNSIDARRILS